jgi:hypothetical protein
MKITKNKRKAKNKPQKFMALEVIKSLPMREIDHLMKNSSYACYYLLPIFGPNSILVREV